MGSDLRQEVRARGRVRGAIGDASGDADRYPDGHELWTRHANREAFLSMERKRRALAARIDDADRHPADRYRDLLLITQLIRFEYEHLAGRIGRDDRESTPLDSGLGRDTPAAWARPWGTGPMFELRAAFLDYSRQCDRLGRRLSGPIRDRAVAAADQEMARIAATSRLQRISDERKLRVGEGRKVERPTREVEPSPHARVIGRVRDARPWESPVFVPACVTVAILFLVAVIGTQVGGGSRDANSKADRGGPVLPAAALTALAARAEAEHSTQAREIERSAPVRHREHKRHERAAKPPASPSEPVLAAEETPEEPAPEPASEPEPAPAPTYSPEPAPSPAPAETQPSENSPSADVPGGGLAPAPEPAPAPAPAPNPAPAGNPRASQPG